MVLGPLIGAAGSILGGVIGAAKADDAADQAWDRQKKTLTHQIQWKVADAVKAGLHPLAGLGVNPTSGPAASVGGEILGSGISDAGQNLSRAAEAMMTPQDKSASRVMELQLERGALENDLLRTQIASQRMRNMQQGTPGVPNIGGPAVTKGGTPAHIPGIPPGWTITNPQLGSQMEDAYSEWSNVAVLPAFMHDAAKYLGLERMLTLPTPTQLGAYYGKKLNQAVKGQPSTRMPNSGDFN